MESRRQKKISSLIQKELSSIFQKYGPDYYGKAFVTITHVRVTPDLSIARIYISVYNIDDHQQVINILSRHISEFRGKLGNRLRNQLRKIPGLEFYLDETLDEVFRLEQIFKGIKKEGEDKP